MLYRLAMCCAAVLFAALFCTACAKNTEAETEGHDTTEPADPENVRPKQPIISSIYTADPSAHVFADRIYIYPSHDPDYDGPMRSDDDGSQYMMEDYHVLSLDDLDSPCVDHGVALHLDDVPWARRQLWAPDAAYRDGTYYLYFPARDHGGIFRIGVATGDSPAGPFAAQPEYIPGSFSIDPAVFTDDDGSAYMVFGGIWGGQLEKWQSGAYDPDAVGPAGDAPALGPRIAELTDDMLGFTDTTREIAIVDENGELLTAGDESRRFFEGGWIHKHGGKYYLSYSTGTTHYIVYAASEDIWGPYVYRGRILNPVRGWTTHHSIVRFRDKWYLFYHDATLSGGVDYKRSVNYTALTVHEDGTIRTIDPYAD